MKKKSMFGDIPLPFMGKKSLLIMKQIFILMLVFNLNAFSAINAQQISEFRVQNATLKSCIKKVESLTGLGFLYNGQELERIGGISLDLKNVDATVVLESVLKGTGYTYKLTNGVIAIMKAAPAAPAPKRPIKGVVKDKDGMTLPGVSVLIKGTQSGVATDINGSFEINVDDDPNLVLSFSFVGMQTQEIKIGANKVLTVVLQSDAQSLDEVVVTGYQTISKERATGSFSVLTNKDFENKLQPSIMSRMEGMAAGLTSYKGDIRIRGTATISGNTAPLYVVDGFPYEGSLDAINPSEIVNITILKDATAASIYGARSANGVIVISTRRGTDKTTVEYNGTVVITPLKDSRDYLNLMNSAELVDFQKEMFDTWHSPTIADKRNYMNEIWALFYQEAGGEISSDEMNRQLDIYRNRDNYDELKDNFLRTKVTHQHNLSLRGGADKYKYSASVNYMQLMPYEKERGDERIGFNIKSNYDFFSWLRADLGVIGSYTNSDNTSAGFDARKMMNGGRASYQTLYDENGKPLKWYQGKSQSEIDRLMAAGLNDESYYPLEEVGRKKSTGKEAYTNLNLALNVKIIEGLTVDLRYQLEKTTNQAQNLKDKDSYEVRTQINNSTKILPDGAFNHLIPEGGQITETRSDKNSYTLRGQINFNRTFADKHEISALAGGERRGIRSTSTYVEKYGYDEISLAHKYIDEVLLSTTQSGTEALNGSYTHKSGGYGDTFKDKEDRYVAFYGNASYTYDTRYAATASIRMDQSNLFGTDPKYQYKPLWSVGVSWFLNHEEFMKDISWIDRLALRVTKGINGNIAKQSGPYMIVYSSGLNGWTGDYSSRVSSPPNSGLRWERTNQTNVGVDFSFFDNRLGGSVEYYSKNTSDLLGSIAVDPTSGWQKLTMNYAEMFNRGCEINLNSVNIRTKDFRWTTSLNFSYNKNEITKLENSENSVDNHVKSTNTREGMPMGTLFSFRWAGLDADGAPQVYKKDGSIAKSMVDVAVEDLVESGTSTPPYSASMSNMLTYKGFDLSFMFIYYGGHVMRDVMPGYITSTGYSRNVDKDIRNYWKGPEDSNDPSKSPAFKRNASSNLTRLWYAADKHIKKADYIKLREITLSYNLPVSFLKKVYISGLTINAQVQNVWWWGANGQNLDPESWNGTNVDYIERLPLEPTTYTLGLSIKF